MSACDVVTLTRCFESKLCLSFPGICCSVGTSYLLHCFARENSGVRVLTVTRSIC